MTVRNVLALNLHSFYFFVTAIIAETFLYKTASQLTYPGLVELTTEVKEDDPSVLFRNNHFITLYRHKVGLEDQDPAMFSLFIAINSLANRTNYSNWSPTKDSSPRAVSSGKR